MDVEYPYLGREKDAFDTCVSCHLSCLNSFFAKDVGFKHIKWLCKLHTVNPRIIAWGTYYKFRTTRGGAWLSGAEAYSRGR